MIQADEIIKLFDESTHKETSWVCDTYARWQRGELTNYTIYTYLRSLEGIEAKERALSRVKKERRKDAAEAKEEERMDNEYDRHLARKERAAVRERKQAERAAARERKQAERAEREQAKRKDRERKQVDKAEFITKHEAMLRRHKEARAKLEADLSLLCTKARTALAEQHTKEAHDLKMNR